MTERDSNCKVIFSKPYNIDGWWNWQIVIDGLPVADFGEPENKTVELSEGRHEIQLRSPMIFGIFSTTQKLRMTLRKSDAVTVKVGPDPKFLMIMVFLLIMACMHFPEDRKIFGEVLNCICYAMCGAAVLAMLKGLLFRLTIVGPDVIRLSDRTEKQAVGSSSQSQERAVDPRVKRMADEFAKQNMQRKLSKTSRPPKRYGSSWSFYFLIFGMLTISREAPSDVIGAASLVLGWTGTLVGGSWAKDQLLKQAGCGFFLLGSLICLAITFCPPLGGAAHAVFLSISLSLAVGLSLYFGSRIAEQMQQSKTSGIMSLILLGLIVMFFVPMIITLLLDLIVRHT